MALVDGAEFARKLEDVYGVEFSHDKEDFDGETFSVIRAIDLPRPNGFGILVTRTPRQIEASFRADNFSRALLRSMGEADSDARSFFAQLATAAVEDSLRISMSINGNIIYDLANLPREEWLKIELDCDTRLPTGRLSSEDLNRRMFTTVSMCMGLVLSLLPLEEIHEAQDIEDIGLPEGAAMTVTVDRYERNRVNRARCIEHHGEICSACGFDFGSIYGEWGKHFIEVHHKTPVSEMGGRYRINPVKDLVPVCSNCHSMLHRRNPPLTIDELRVLIRK